MDERRIELLTPDQPYSGTPAAARLKRKIINHVLAGTPIDQIVDLEHINKRTLAIMRRKDGMFDAAIIAAQEEVRKMLLPAVESNIWDQALQPTPSGARIGIRLQEEFGGWGKHNRRLEGNRAAAERNEQALADWYDDPAVFDAEYREVERDAEDEG